MRASRPSFLKMSASDAAFVEPDRVWGATSWIKKGEPIKIGCSSLFRKGWPFPGKSRRLRCNTQDEALLFLPIVSKVKFSLLGLIQAYAAELQHHRSYT